MPDDFSSRLALSVSFEDEVIRRLEHIGWSAFRFGQGQLPDDCRDRLRRFEDSARRPSLLRWMPDIITFLDLPSGKSYVALIDAKIGGSTPNYAIEMSAVETAEIYTDRLFTPTFFVFSDWKVLTPRNARQRGTMGPQKSGGSGTPYLLIAKIYASALERYFPKVRDVVAA